MRIIVILFIFGINYAFSQEIFIKYIDAYDYANPFIITESFYPIIKNKNVKKVIVYNYRIDSISSFNKELVINDSSLFNYMSEFNYYRNGRLKSCEYYFDIYTRDTLIRVWSTGDSAMYIFKDSLPIEWLEKNKKTISNYKLTNTKVVNRFKYSKNHGLLIIERNNKMNITKYFYDSNGNLIKSNSYIDPKNKLMYSECLYSYRRNSKNSSKLLSLVEMDYNNNSFKENCTVHYEYDLQKRLKRIFRYITYNREELEYIYNIKNEIKYEIHKYYSTGELDSVYILKYEYEYFE